MRLSHAQCNIVGNRCQRFTRSWRMQECLVRLDFTLCRVDPPTPGPAPYWGRGERGTGGERGHVIVAKYQNLAEQGKSGEMTFLQWTHDLSCKSFLASGEAWRDPSPAERGRPGGGAPPGNPLTTPFPRFLSTERVCSEAEQGLPCEIGRISQGREKAEKKGFAEGGPSAPPLPARVRGALRRGTACCAPTRQCCAPPDNWCVHPRDHAR
jgi:hypothetical protein